MEGKQVLRKVVNPLMKPLKEFIALEASAGILLCLCAVLSLFLANSGVGESYRHFWHSNLSFSFGSFTIHDHFNHFINDALMAIFFLLVGLEIKRELIDGELSSLKKAMLPILAAVGGMLVPALIYVLFNIGSETIHGWGIPMATDIAFAMALVLLLGDKVPNGLKIFLVALAIADDLGAIVVIALFFGGELHTEYLLMAAALYAFMLYLNYSEVSVVAPYLICGFVLWYFIKMSGIHSTAAGVLTAMAIPSASLYRLEHELHWPVNFIIIPLFALANTAISLNPEMLGEVFSPLGLGIFIGLVLGKPVGITLMSWLCVKLNLASLPAEVSWKHIIGAGVLAGIGFTMSIFLTVLSFPGNQNVQDIAKITIIGGSVISAVVGYVFLNSLNKKTS